MNQSLKDLLLKVKALEKLYQNITKKGTKINRQNSTLTDFARYTVSTSSFSDWKKFSAKQKMPNANDNSTCV